MSRRGGKAASRRSRQRRAQRAAQNQQRASQPRPQEPALTPAPEAEPEAAAPPVDAFEAADAELRASTPPPGARADKRQGSSKRSVRARAGDFQLVGGSSRLTERAAAEYHYVGRDLRNIGILLVVMVVLLAASAIAVNLLGIGQV
jgi:hypothetical protein